ncbi:TauD/TfdA family dioxygenase [Candidatus Neptunochlamydia vexilliferae]|uniref:TauD/TfdA-like domain-containing protein n=1 Tax=Candidatus Neptunichlamydia vexilliferae TaxID=1651774 RepID=A0ABS0AXZ0_9BACT|nr:TauD/TfdA family dioxygenase [Candidatus Neptunochlamydia vexilliferae]MBF5058994.1 hypothetical protein [Candidatus Neptunochlamydia vexilliferae]
MSQAVKITESPDHFLLQIEPLQDTSTSHLKQWLKESHSFIQEKMIEYGGIYFKGFDVETAQDFEDIAIEIDPHLCDRHPFNCSTRTWHTKYTCEVANPNIKKSLIPKGMHNEDAYVGKIPKTIFFHPLEPSKEGGETLVADCRKIYRLLPEKLKKKLRGKAMRNDLVMHDEALLVNGRIPKSMEAIEQLGASHNSKETVRISDNLTRFRFEIPAVINCEGCPDPVWFNLIYIAPTLSYNTYIDTWFAYSHLGGCLNKLRAIRIIFSTLYKDIKFWVKSLFNRNPEDPNYLSEVGHYSLTDGTKISFWERVQINLAIWKSAAVVPLKKGEIVALDNRLTSHGRMPFKGRRVFLAALGSLMDVSPA